MEVLIHGKNVDITPRLQSYIERKVDRLDRYLPNIHEVRVDLADQKSSRMGDGLSAQITLRHARGTILRAEERTSDIYVAVDSAVDKMFRQIERFKGKRKKRGEAPNDYADYETAVELAETDVDTGRIARRKLFSVMPMLEEEAIEQLDLLGHDFFAFFNGETNQINVLYRRRDGDYGLLEPDT